jgi:Tuftelin interacting protein N terminal
MWADEEEDGGGKNKQKHKERKSYNAPVAFVSGGIKIGDKVTKENADEEDDNITVSFSIV